MDYTEIATKIAIEEGIDPELFLRLIEAESSFNPDALSEMGAIGLTQLMPSTAKELGVDPYDPEQNLRGGARYLKRQLDDFGSVPLALAAYNAGPGNVRKHGGIPPFQVTQDYVSRIVGSGPADRAFNGKMADIPLNMGKPAPQTGVAQTAEKPELPQWMKMSQQFGTIAQQPVDALSGYDPYAIAQQFAIRQN